MALVKRKSPRVIRGDSVGNLGNCDCSPYSFSYRNGATMFMMEKTSVASAMIRVAQALNSERCSNRCSCSPFSAIIFRH